MNYGMFTGCACCPEFELCSPKVANVGEVSMNSWGYGPTSVTDRKSSAAVHCAELSVIVTHGGGGVYTFRFEKAYTRTFHIPTVDGRSPAWWDYDSTWFDNAVAVSFTAADLTVFFNGSPVVADDAADVLFHTVFGLSPFDVTLQVFPITLAQAPTDPGVVAYPSAFSTGEGIPPPYAPLILDHIESSWANLQWFYGPAGVGSNLPWGRGIEGGETDLTYNDSRFFMSYTHHRRGYTFLPSGLGPLDLQINQFGSTWGGGFPSWMPQSQPFPYVGECYAHRLNDFYADLSVSINLDWDTTGWDAHSTEIINGFSGTYTLEWDHTDRMFYTGRNDYWIQALTIKSNGIWGGDPSPIEFNKLAQYNTALSSGSPIRVGVTIDSQVLFGAYKDYLYGNQWINGYTSPTEFTFDEVKNLPGVGSAPDEFDAAYTNLFLTDPSAFIEAIFPSLVWAENFPDPTSDIDWTTLSVNISLV